jgi:hypothetical protein
VSWRLRLLLPAVGLALAASVLLGAAPASAAPSVAGTQLALTLPPPTRTGQAAALTGSLVARGAPLARAAVHVMVDGVPTLTLQTRSDGSFLYRFPRSTPAGSHAVVVWYHGSQPLGLAPASASGTLTLLPLTLTLRTLPALPGTRFTVDGRPSVAGADGTAAARVATIGPHEVGVEPPADTDSTRYRLARWLDGETAAERTIRVFDDSSAVASFSSSFLVPISFQDANGAALDTRRLSRVGAIGPGGAAVDLVPSRRSTWLTLTAPSHAAFRVEDQPGRFALASAEFDGVSVANRGDAPYVPAPGRQWTIKLRVFSISVHVRRPLLGWPQDELVVRSRAGVERTAETGAGGDAVFRDLPRGLYDVTVRGARVGPGARVQVTRNQAVDVTVYTMPEVGLGLLVVLTAVLGAVAVALLVRGRLRPNLAAIRGGRG